MPTKKIKNKNQTTPLVVKTWRRENKGGADRHHPEDVSEIPNDIPAVNQPAVVSLLTIC